MIKYVILFVVIVILLLVGFWYFLSVADRIELPTEEKREDVVLDL